jgi:aspartate racemase
MKIAGVIGGISPGSTAEFYMDLNKMSMVRKDVSIQLPPMLVWNIPATLPEVMNVINKGEGLDIFTPYMVEAAKALEKGGADFITIPCNTIHLMIKETRAAVNIPVMSIIEETVKFLTTNNISKFALMTTQQTRDSELYGKVFKEHNLEYEYPSAEDQDALNILIRNTGMNNVNEEDKKQMYAVIEKFKDKGFKYLLLACGQFTKHFKTPVEGLEVYDTMKILTQNTFDEIWSE